MRKSIWIISLIVLVACLLLILFRTKHEQKNVLIQSVQAATDQVKPLTTPIIKTQATSPASDLLIKALTTPPSIISNAFGKFNAQTLALWQAPIDFYGKVVDENTNSVANAQITFHWMEVPADAGSKSLSVKSDIQGLFSLKNAKGPSLIVSVSKEGYYTSRSTPDGFHYSLGNDSFQPDALNPVIFHLQKKGQGEELIQKDFPPGFTQIWQLHHDGTPIELDLMNGSQNVNGSGQLKLEFWRDLSDRNAKRFDWKLQITAFGGGIIPTDEEFAFEAPKTGYQPSVVIDMSATNQVWLGELRTKYYVQLPNGNYGRFDFYFLSYNGVFTVKSWVSPDGARNLEPK